MMYFQVGPNSWETKRRNESVLNTSRYCHGDAGTCFLKRYEEIPLKMGRMYLIVWEWQPLTQRWNRTADLCVNILTSSIPGRHCRAFYPLGLPAWPAESGTGLWKSTVVIWNMLKGEDQCRFTTDEANTSGSNRASNHWIYVNLYMCLILIDAKNWQEAGFIGGNDFGR